ncbi:NUDIX domain-containing protein [Amaricoccus macauensis]|uniref:NUDIX domain-containing protein n=1 Tax=Amaricoccus macauensis TaxID=57001 RepID=UPI003C7D3EAF
MAGAPRLAVRAIIVEAGRFLLVNAYPDKVSDLWCAPGGGVEAHASLPDNLAREVREETGLLVTPGRLLAVSEFHSEASGFHQVELFFAATPVSTALDPAWADPEGIVTERQWFSPAELGGVRFKPDFLPQLAFDPPAHAIYDPLEPMIA